MCARSFSCTKATKKKSTVHYKVSVIATIKELALPFVVQQARDYRFFNPGALFDLPSFSNFHYL